MALLLEAMGIHNDIFTKDIIALRQDKEKVIALKLPYLIKIKEHVLKLPVFTQHHTWVKIFIPHVVNESIIPVASPSLVPLLVFEG